MQVFKGKENIHITNQNIFMKCKFDKFKFVKQFENLNKLLQDVPTNSSIDVSLFSD